jgi:soluble lytic murein transglycosylase-like protein
MGLWALAWALPLAAAGPGDGLTSVVRADMRTGRLVRSTVVAPRTLAARVVAAREVDSTTEKTAEPRRGANLAEIIADTARTHAVDPLLVHSVIEVESNYNPYAVSPKGAQGIMQLIPATARRFGVANSFDVRQNIEGGVRYLKYLQALFKDDRLALAAYNAGEGAVQKYGDIPPYAETEQYVYRVGKKYGEARARQKQAGQAAEPRAAAPPLETARHLEAVTGEDGGIRLKTR